MWGGISFHAVAQTFTGSGATIPDNGQVLEVPLEVSGLGSLIDTATFGLEQVCISIDHSWIGDLEVSIVAPDGTAGLLVRGQGGSADRFSGTCFDPGAPTSIVSASAPYTGLFRPQGQMGSVNNGQSGDGTWRLRVHDTYPFADTGHVLDWSITFGDTPAGYFVFTASDLPLFVIDTDGQSIPHGTKITGSMGVVDNGAAQLNRVTDAFNAYSGAIGIEIRGNSSATAPKKSFGVELRDPAGNDLDHPLLGMAAEADWILSANYFDKSLLNNALAYHLGRQMGRYAPHTRHVEVVLNGEYQGVYVLTERIKRGAGRLDIARLRPQDLFGDQLTGGYILSIDRNDGPGSGFFSDHAPLVNDAGQQIHLRYRYPKREDIAPQQALYIQEYIDTFEGALASDQFTDPNSGYRALADASSFVDLLLLNEISRNVDGYRLSTYVHKDRDSHGGKLHAGPAWDYDIAWGNADYCSGSDIGGWAYDFGTVCPHDGSQLPFWWARMLEDPGFVAELRCRWEELRSTVLSPANIEHFCDSTAAVLATAQVRNFHTWPILGTYVWPNPSPIPQTYAGEVDELKSWVASRWSWLNTNFAGACNTGLAQSMVAADTPVFPNPFTDHVWWPASTKAITGIRLLDIQGRSVYSHEGIRAGGQATRIDLPAELPTGIYMLGIRYSDGQEEFHRLTH